LKQFLVQFLMLAASTSRGSAVKLRFAERECVAQYVSDVNNLVTGSFVALPPNGLVGDKAQYDLKVSYPLEALLCFSYSS
jgi:hypothetical protein